MITNVTKGVDPQQYEVKLMTKRFGVVTITVSESEDMEQREKQIHDLYGDFVTICATPISA